MAIVAEGTRGRVYLSATTEEERAAEVSLPPNYPDTDLPKQALSVRVMLYGMDKHFKLFTPRQLTALVTFSDLVKEARAKVLADANAPGTLPADERPLDAGGTGPQAYADAVATYLAFAVSKAANRGCTLCFWDTGAGKVQQAFGRQALPITWDFCEANPFSNSSGSWNSHIEFTAKCAAWSPCGTHGTAVQRSAVAIPPGATVISTDPPYYDNIGYADLSDFFYIWLRRSLSDVFPKLLSTVLTPKGDELIASPYRHDGSKQKAQEFFETGLGKAFTAMRTNGREDFPLTVFYAFKQTEERESEEETAGETPALPASTGWETMLEGLIHAGFEITGTWPMRTELVGNLKKNVSALASSVVLSCRGRPVDAILATRREFLAALKKELPDALRHLQAGNIAPVDLSQAAIGPGMAIFTRYAKVIEADGSPMRVRQALTLINQTLDEILAEQEGEFDADTRWALAWFEQFGMNEGAFGVAETLSKAKNTAINGLVEAGLIAARSGKVRLLKRSELPADWNPATDKKLRHWEITQHLIRILESNGEQAAAALLRQLGGMGEAARDLAYRLYVICERKKWADEALAYNGLVIAWPEMSKLAARAPTPEQTQEKMFQ
jgi:putative DNA methylase